MNDLATFLSALMQQQPPGQEGSEPITPGFAQWLLKQPQIPSYGKGGNGMSGLGNTLTGLMNGNFAGNAAANANAGLLSSL